MWKRKIQFPENYLSRKTKVKGILLSAALILILTSPCLHAAGISLAWDPNTESNLAGYKVYYGNSPRQYSRFAGFEEYTLLAGSVNQPSFTATGLPAGTYYFAVTAYDFSGHESDYSNEVSVDLTNTWMLPSSAHAPGKGTAYYRTDLTLANPSNSSANITLKFLGNNVDGSSGAEKTYPPIPPKNSVTFKDVLASVFNVGTGFGAIKIDSTNPGLAILSQTYTAGSGGTFGQSVPAMGMEHRITAGNLGAISGVRQDAQFRTNLIMANVKPANLDVDVTVVSEGGIALGHKHIVLLPFGMTQFSGLSSLGVNSDVRGAYFLLSTPTAGGDFAAYASVIDNQTNDPRTLLTTVVGGDGVPASWILTSAARAGGQAGAYFTTELAIANIGNSLAQATLKYLGNNKDGRDGKEVGFQLAGGKAVTYSDLLSAVFGLNSNSDFGAVLIKSSSSALSIISQTSTPAPGGGTFGLSVPAVLDSQLISSGISRSIPGIREDANFRTNLIMCNGTEIPIDINVAIVSETGIELAHGNFALYPLGMTQSRVVREFGINGDLSGARIELSTPTAGAAFTAYATVIDNVTNDPRTLLPW